VPKNQHKVRLGRAAPTMAVSDIQASYRFYRFYQALFGLEKTFENGSPVGFMIRMATGSMSGSE
jgi:lactoylglutathione lyase